jgi:prevent-host-death family protein
MTRLPASRARDEFADLLNKVAYAGDRIVLHRHGKDVAALISIEDLARLQAYEDAQDVEASRASLADPEPPIPWDELKKELPY